MCGETELMEPKYAIEELEQQFAVLKDKVRELREYL